LSGTEILVAALLAIGVALELTSVLGVLVGSNVYARLHFTGPASTFTPLALAIAVVIHYGPFSQAGVKSTMVAALIVLLGPALAHATARAARIRQKGGIE
jgi:monovalent cation/proton antiporter MnhG/PhaG subunit